MKESEKQLDDIYIFWLERVTKALKRHKKDFFKSLNVDLTSDQWVIIKRCDEQPGITQKELAESTFKDPASITRILDILISKKLVDKRIGTDRRNFEIHLTTQGNRIINKALPLAAETRSIGLQNISDSETKNLISILEKIWNNLI